MASLVSILIPAYNAEKWIGETIQSAMDQTWPAKEIIVVDDGSLDETYRVAKQYESANVKAVTQDNRGASAARNKALTFAQGDYIQWLDADDILEKDKISEQMKFAADGREDLTLLSSPFGRFYWRREKARFSPDALWQDLNPADWLLNKFRDNYWMVPAVWLVSRRLTEMAGPWDERLAFDDDGEYFCRVVAASKNVRFVPSAKCYYRQSGFNQLSRKFTEKTRESLLLSLTLCIECLRSLEDSERTRTASLMFLQECLPYFYPEKNEQLDKINALARRLGGSLQAPKSGWKLHLLRRVLGPNRGGEVMHALRKLKFSLAVKYDEMLYRLEKPS